MRRICLSIGLLAVLLVVVAQSIQRRSEPKMRVAAEPPKGQKETGDRTTAKRAADEAAIRANVAAFVRAYNAGGAKAVAALFTAEAHIMDKEGTISAGREAIKDIFAKLFAAHPHKRLEVFIDSIRFLGPDL